MTEVPDVPETGSALPVRVRLTPGTSKPLLAFAPIFDDRRPVSRRNHTEYSQCREAGCFDDPGPDYDEAPDDECRA